MAAAFAACSQASQGSQKPMSSDYVCESPPYTVSIVSRSPMVLYLHDFITPEERAHLKAVTYDSMMEDLEGHEMSSESR